MKLLATIALSLGFFAAIAAAQSRPSYQPIRDRVLVRTRFDLPIAPLPGAALATTGDRLLDERLSQLQVSSVRRVFHRPPRGFANPAAAAEVGLDRWLVATWSHPWSDQALDALVRDLSSVSSVEHVDREQPVLLADTVPNDPDFGSQYSLQNGKLNAPKAWDIIKETDRVVAIIDTGVELTHKDLKANIWKNPGEIPGNGIDDEGNGYIDDDHGWDIYYNDNKPNDKFGHGIHCAGIAGAVTNDALQVSGVCWSVPIMPVKVFSDSAGGDHATCAAGMVYAADNGAAVFSMSWGFFDSMPVLEAAVDYAAKLDVVQVAAAHNYGSTDKMYPAAYPKVMGIIATDASDQKTSWSNYGNWCDMAAPGDNILSLYLNDSTAYLSGTSMSTPHVAGAAALVRGANPSLDAVDTRWVLNYSAVDLGSAGFDINYGWGRLDLLAAVEKARMLTCSTNDAVPGDTVSLSLDRASDAGFVYVLLATSEGRRPGLALRTYDPADYRQIAANFDGQLFPLVLYSGGAGIFQSFIGNLDANGHASAAFNIPKGHNFADHDIDFVFVTFDPGDVSHVSSASNSVQVAVGH